MPQSGGSSLRANHRALASSPRSSVSAGSVSSRVKAVHDVAAMLHASPELAQRRPVGYVHPQFLVHLTPRGRLRLLRRT